MNSFDVKRFQSLLRTHALGREFHHFNLTDSTNTRLKELAAQGAAEGAVAFAEQQSAGRGRWGRTWVSPASKNLLFSFLLKPGSRKLSQLTALFGLACLDALKIGKLKWPNDIWVNGKKIGGILIEGSGDALIVGVGINVNQSAAEFPEALRDTATSLFMENGEALDREALLAELLRSCQGYYDFWCDEGFLNMDLEWKEKALFIGENVRAGEWEGKVLGLDDDGALLIQTSHGVEKLVSGEVFGMRPSLD